MLGYILYISMAWISKKQGTYSLSNKKNFPTKFKIFISSLMPYLF